VNEYLYVSYLGLELIPYPPFNTNLWLQETKSCGCSFGPLLDLTMNTEPQDYQSGGAAESGKGEGDSESPGPL
jgi:hypothetical protein